MGNVRVSFRKSATGTAELLQKDDYYPFGLTFNSYASGAKNLYLNQGKELQEELDTYDFHARMYDPAIGRTFQQDPHAENYFSWSPYSWAGNNPLIMIDPTGMDWYEAYDDDGNVTSSLWREGSDAMEGYTNIGANYTQDLGGGVSVTFTQNEATSMTETVLTEGDWETQREPIYNNQAVQSGSQNKQPIETEGNCFYQAGVMVSNSGATSLGGTANNTTGTTNIVDYAKSQASLGNSVRMNVDYDSNGTGDHWVAISSVTTNLQTQTVSSMNFYDPGTVNQQSGTHSTNTFTVQNGTLSGTTFYNGKTYNVTAVRKNSQ